MGLDVLLGALGGGFEGAAKGYSWQKEYEQQDRRLDQQNELAKLREDVRLMVEYLREGGREGRWDRPSGNVVTQQQGAMDRLEVTEAGRDTRHATPSGNQLAALEGAFSRHITPSGNALVAEEGRDERWMTPSANARMQADTTRRGQDIGSGDRRRGQDLTFDAGTMRDETTRRGQDMRDSASRFTAHEATKRAGMRRDPYQVMFNTPVTPMQEAAPPAEPPPTAAPAPAPARTPVRPTTVPGGTSPNYRWPDGTTRAYPPGGSASANLGRTPVSPPASNQPPQPKTAEAVVDREQQRRTTFESLKKQIDERKRKGLDFADLLQQMQALRTK
jgi:hypothetical protein